MQPITDYTNTTHKEVTLLKPRINRLNALVSYKTVLKPSLSAKLQTTDYLDILISCFSLCMEKHFNL